MHRESMPLTDPIELSLFSGVIGEAIAEVKLYVAYVVDDELQLDTQPINFTVNPATSIMPLLVFPEKDTVISSRSGTLTQTQNLFVGERVRGVCLTDFKNDGDPDIVATPYTGNLVALFTNDRAGNFSDAVTFDVGDGEWPCASADITGIDEVDDKLILFRH